MIEHRIEEFACCKCGKPVKTIWAYDDEAVCRGLISNPGYVLVADWVYHTECFDEVLRKDPGAF